MSTLGGTLLALFLFACGTVMGFRIGRSDGITRQQNQTIREFGSLHPRPQPGGRTCCPTPAPGAHTGTCPNSVMMCGEERWFATDAPGSAPGHD